MKEKIIYVLVKTLEKNSRTILGRCEINIHKMSFPEKSLNINYMNCDRKYTLLDCFMFNKRIHVLYKIHNDDKLEYMADDLDEFNKYFCKFSFENYTSEEAVKILLDTANNLHNE